MYNWACSIKAFLQVPEACFYFLIHCQTTFFLVHFSCLGICQVVPHCVLVHGIEEGELFICRHQLFQWKNFSDVLIPFISGCGTPSCIRSFHTCLFGTCEVTFLVLPPYFLSFTPCTSGSEITQCLLRHLPVALVTFGVIECFREMDAPLKTCNLILFVAAVLSRLGTVISPWAIPICHSKLIPFPTVHRFLRDDTNSAIIHKFC